MTHAWTTLPKPCSLGHHSHFSPILSGLDCLSNPLFSQLWLFAITLVWSSFFSCPFFSPKLFYPFLYDNFSLDYATSFFTCTYLSLCIFYICHIVKYILKLTRNCYQHFTQNMDRSSDFYSKKKLSIKNTWKKVLLKTFKVLQSITSY